MKKLKKLPAVLAVLIVTVMVFCSCSGANYPGENLMEGINHDENYAYKFKSGKTESPGSYVSYKDYAADFAFKMLRASYKNDNNTVISAAGLYAQLSLLENAASDESFKQIKDLTGINQPIESLNECNAYFFARLEKLSKKNNYVNIKNNLFFNKNIRVGQKFLLTNADYYNQGLFATDFADEDTYKKINEYTASLTNDEIKNIIQNPIPQSYGIVAAGTTLMRDKWLSGYDRQDTSTGEFNGKKGTEKAEFMTGTEFYLEGKRCTGFEKSFKNTPCKFIALLPNEDVNIYKFIKELNSSEYRKILSSLSVFKTCEASVPGFSVKYSGSYTKALNECGVYEMFNQKGNLHNLSFNQKGSVGDVVHSVELEINAAGAGADKPVISKVKKKAPDKKVILNRPFLFMIVDNESYIPIFAGIIADI